MNSPTLDVGKMQDIFSILNRIKLYTVLAIQRTGNKPMSRYDDIQKTIQNSSELSGLLKEAADALLDYAKAGQPVWQAEQDRVRAEAVAAGKKAFAVPFEPEALVVDDPVALQAFLIAGLEFGGATSRQELADALKNERDEYRAKCKIFSPAP